MAKKEMTLVEYKKAIPSGGLLNPGLRTGFGKIVDKKGAMAAPKCGNFANVASRKRGRSNT